MISPRRISCLALAALLGVAALAIPAGSSAAVASIELTFKEPDKGSTFAYVDAAPKTTLNKYGFPKSISAGDQIVITDPVFEGGKRIGTLQASCIATKNSIGGGKTIEGAIVGGTVIYSGATGTFTSTEYKSYEETVIKLTGE